MRMSRSAGAVSVDCQCLVSLFIRDPLPGFMGEKRARPRNTARARPARPIVRNRASVVTLVARGTAPPASVGMPAAFVPFRHMAPAYDAGHKAKDLHHGPFLDADQNPRRFVRAYPAGHLLCREADPEEPADDG